MPYPLEMYGTLVMFYESFDVQDHLTVDAHIHVLFRII